MASALNFGNCRTVISGAASTKVYRIAVHAPWLGLTTGIVPQSIVRPIDMSLVAVAEGDYVTVPLEADEEVDNLTPEQRVRLIGELEERMREAARKFEFEKAAQFARPGEGIEGGGRIAPATRLPGTELPPRSRGTCGTTPAPRSCHRCVELVWAVASARARGFARNRTRSCVCFTA